MVKSLPSQSQHQALLATLRRVNDAANRRSQSDFVCKGCGHAAHADTNAAGNICRRAAVMQRIVSNTDDATRASSAFFRDKPATLAVGS
jgi:hypothetical protein